MFAVEARESGGRRQEDALTNLEARGPASDQAKDLKQQKPYRVHIHGAIGEREKG